MMTGELRRKLVNDLIKIIEVDKKNIKILMLLPKMSEQDMMFKNFKEYFNKIEFKRLGQERASDSFNELMYNCRGKESLRV